MNRRKFTTGQELTDAIIELHKKAPNTWLHLSNEAVDSCNSDGLMVLRTTESEDWNLLGMITIEGEAYRFNLKNPDNVLFFEMA